MARIGYDGSSGWYGWVATGTAGNNLIVGVNNANNKYVMPESGYVTGFGVYAAGTNGYTPAAEIYVTASGTVILWYDFTLSGGSNVQGGQHWNTSTGYSYFLAAGTVVSVGIWTDPNAWRVWSYQNDSAYQWDDGKVSTRPSQGGTLGSHTVNGSQKMGAYLDYTPAPPIINSLSATSGGVGSQFTINGYAFQSATAVYINGTGCVFTINSDQQLTVTVPAGATSGQVEVANSYGTTFGPTFTVGAAPANLSMTPTSGGAGTSISVSGNYLSTVSGVTINGVAASFVVNSDTSVTVTEPSSGPTGSVVLTNPYGNGTAGTFTYNGVAPTISGVTPTSGYPGTTLSVSGKSFTGTSTVTIGGASCAFVVNSDTSLSVTISVNAFTGVLVVTNGGGSTTGPTITVYQVRVANASTLVGGQLYVANTSTNGWHAWTPAHLYVANASTFVHLA